MKERAAKMVRMGNDRAAVPFASGEFQRRRRELGLTQADLADLAGVSDRSVRALEAGKATLRLDVVAAVVDALGLELQLALRTSA